MKKLKLATIWLDGCSGCHMSLLDLDGALIPIVRKVDIVYGPLVDAQEFPEDVDVTLVEGAISTQEDIDKLHQIRARQQVAGLAGRLRCNRQCGCHAQRVSGEQAVAAHLCRRRRCRSLYSPRRAAATVKQARPAQDFVKVDVCLPGCPPQNKVIAGFLTTLLEGRKPEANQKIKFG